ncbi:glycosyltransferase family 4 protein [Vibrio cyclitrophicus]|uniref:glycosyltransferase family 4 protein n=1 Tax=Vibrio cyclitrophicus TaxID=47951 RepID=UPI0002EE1A41|nr:glycosyltransferase family 4 protein [Vibrio cyclitrophicus]
MKKIFYLTKHQSLGASSRYRSLQYFPFLIDNGYKVVHAPLFCDGYLILKYSGNKLYYFLAIWAILKRLAVSLYLLFDNKSIIVIEKEVIPYFPPVFEWMFKVTGRNYILDYDDAVWHNYDKFKESHFCAFLYNKHRRIIQWASGVNAGSEYILNFAKSVGARRVVKIPTVIDYQRYNKRKGKCSRDDNKIIIGWIGSPTSSQYLLSVESAISRLQEDLDVEVHLIGADKEFCENLRFRNKVIQWSEEHEILELSYIDIGIMPLSDSRFEKGKCAFKLIQYMAMSKPVVCSPVGENSVLVKHGESGLYAHDDDEWYEMLFKLINDEKLRLKIGLEGNRVVREGYTLESQCDKYLDFIEGDFNG